MPKLEAVSITGLDETITVDQLFNVIQRFRRYTPMWFGLLVHADRKPSLRFPGPDWVSELVEAMSVAKEFCHEAHKFVVPHLCGTSWLDYLLFRSANSLLTSASVSQMLKALAEVPEIVGGIQLNISQVLKRAGAVETKAIDVFIDNLVRLRELLSSAYGFYKHIPIILQTDKQHIVVSRAVEALENVYPLVDSSGGKGISTHTNSESISSCIVSSGDMYGVAGGINFSNVHRIIAESQLSGYSSMWICLESGIRDADNKVSVHLLWALLQQLDSYDYFVDSHNMANFNFLRSEWFSTAKALKGIVRDMRRGTEELPFWQFWQRCGFSIHDYLSTSHSLAINMSMLCAFARLYYEQDGTGVSDTPIADE